MFINHHIELYNQNTNQHTYILKHIHEQLHHHQSITRKYHETHELDENIFFFKIYANCFKLSSCGLSIYAQRISLATKFNNKLSGVINVDVCVFSFWLHFRFNVKNISRFIFNELTRFRYTSPKNTCNLSQSVWCLCSSSH